MIYLYNNQLEKISIIGKDDLREFTTTEELNSQWIVEISYPFYLHKKETEYVGFKDNNEFKLYKITNTSRSDDFIDINGVHIFFHELKGRVIRDIRPQNKTAGQVIEQLFEGANWTVRSTASGLNSSNYYYVSILDAINDVIDKWQVEIKPTLRYDGSSLVRELIVEDHISKDYGRWFEYGDKLLTVVAEENHSNVFTAFIGRGKGEETGEGYSRKIKFDSIYWSISNGDPVNKPIGQDYVEIEAATSLYGYPDGSPRITTVDFDNIEDKRELLQATYEYALENSRPKVQLKANAISDTRVEIGEIATIIRPDLDIRYKTRIFKVSTNLLSQTQEFEFGDKIVISQASRIKAQQKKTEKKIQETESRLEEFLKTVNLDFFNEDAYNYELPAGNEYGLPAGYYSFNKPIDENPTSVTYIGAGKVLIANNKGPNGEWIWKTAITGEGIAGDSIITNSITTNKLAADVRQSLDLLSDTSISSRVGSIVSNYVEENKDMLKGEDGKDGKDGQPGRDGVDGQPGKDGEAGPQGPKGADGKTPVTHFAYLGLDDQEITDPHFEKGINGIEAVKASDGGGSVTITRQENMTTSTQPVGNDRIMISHTAGGSPDRGGFSAPGGEDNKVYIVRFTALVPVGAHLRLTTVFLAEDGAASWLGNRDGTGKFREYAYLVKTGTGSKGWNQVRIEYNKEVFDWWVSSYERFDITDKFSFNPFDGATHMGIYSDYLADQSEDLRKYQWAKIRGNDGKDGIAGKDGVGITSTTIHYAGHNDGINPPSSGWQTSVPVISPGYFLWTRTKWSYSDDTSETGYSVSKIGENGNDGKDGIAGKDGVGLKSTQISYASSSDGLNPPSTGWLADVPNVKTGDYLWTKTTWTYTDNTSETGYSVSRFGQDGANGKTPIMHFAYLALDKKETSDPHFEKGLNGAAVYNSAGDGSVVITRQVDMTTSTQPVGNDRIMISHKKAGGSPNRGGFVINASAEANKVYLIEFTALLPVGAKLQMNHSSLGSGGATYWISGNEGTGKFQNYSYVIKYGTGSIGDAGQVSIIHSKEVFDWYVSYYERYDITNKFSFNPFDGATHVGIYSDYSSTQSNLISKYQWSLTKGEKGDTGPAGKDGTVDYEYLIANGYVSYSSSPPSDTSRLWVDSTSYPRVMYYYDPNMELSEGQTSRDRWIPLDNQITQQMTNLEQTINEFNFSFTSVSEFRDEQSNTSLRFAEINKYIRFIDGKVHISEEGNPFNIIISNDRISFMNNDTEIAYCKGDEFYVDKLQALTKLTVGNIEITNITSTVAGIVVV